MDDFRGRHPDGLRVRATDGSAVGRPRCIGPAAAAGEPARPPGFDDWVSRFRDTARAAGVDEATLHVAFDDVHYLPRVVELDRAQPEFTRTVWDYLDSGRVAATRRSTGQRQAARAA